MGRLIAKTYPTSMLMNLANHTYVECGAGAKGWGCWGGKTGGATIGFGEGSTKCANAIAEADERAGITCYAINGVCHQAANRILLPVGGTVAKARGYGLSVALFGVYGRPAGPLGTCLAPLNSHSALSGDLDECLDTGPEIASPFQDKETTERERAMSQDSLFLYAQSELIKPSAESRVKFQLAQFEIFAMHRLRKRATDLGKLLRVQQKFEISRTTLENQLAERVLSRATFAERLNDMTISYQSSIADVLTPAAYTILLDSSRDERLILCDPSVFSAEPAPRSRGPGPDRWR